MPISTPQWTEFLTCPICSHDFNDTQKQPISLGCGHTVCKSCLSSLHRTVCPFDQSAINIKVDILPVNYALLQLHNFVIPAPTCPDVLRIKEHKDQYFSAKKCIEELALFLSPLVSKNGSASEANNNGLTNGTLSRPMHRKLVTLVNCQLAEEEGCARIMRAIRSLGERTVLEFILLHQNSAQLSQNLWTAVRNRGCQFLGPAMQEDALKYILLALEGGEALSRKVIVLFVVQRLEQVFPHASKTSIGHVVQLLYRASCFKVTKRDDESSLMQLKEQYRTYDALRREHDSQIVQIALEAGLRISPEQWSALLYGDQGHKSHMQSIIDKLQTPESFASSIQELTIALQRSSDPAQLGRLREHFELLSRIDGSPDATTPSWQELEDALKAVTAVVHGLVEFTKSHGVRVKATSEQPVHSKFKTSMCRDFAQRNSCPRGQSCTFAHSEDELDKYRRKAKAARPGGNGMVNARGGIAEQLSYSPSNHNDEASENGHGNRNGSVRSSSLCMQNNGQDYPVSSASYGQLVHRGHSNHNNHDAMVQQLRNLSMHSQPQSMYNGQENGYRNPIVTDCLTPPHNSEQSFSYSWMSRPNGYSAMNGNGHVNNGHVNGHIENVVRAGPTRTSPLTVEEEAALNGLNGVNGMNGLNGVNGIMNGHSEYAALRCAAEELRRRKGEAMNYARYRCAQFVQPNGYHQFPPNHFYPNDVGRYGPVGTRVMPDIDRFNAYHPRYSPSSLSQRTLIDAQVDPARMDLFHNPSFHPHSLYQDRTAGRSPHIPADSVGEDSDSGIKADGDAKSLFIEDHATGEDGTYSRPHLSSVSSGVSSGDSFGSHSPRSHSPVNSPRQHSPDAWAGSAETDISTSVWSNIDFPAAPFLPPRSEDSDLKQVWTPINSELSTWPNTGKEKSEEVEKDSAPWPRISNKKRPSHQALLESYTSCSGYWSDPELTTRFQQTKNDEIIARTLQNDEGSPEMLHSEVTPSAPPASEIFDDQAIALELQNMENDEHGMKVEKERLEFEERKEKEMIKMKQIEEDHLMALRVQNEQDGVRYVTDEETIKLHERRYKEHTERAKELNSKDQESKDRRLAESLVYEDAYNHGLLPRPDPEVLKPIKYPVKIVSRGPRRISPAPPVNVDVLDTAVP